jgi:hypothetical protein
MTDPASASSHRAGRLAHLRDTSVEPRLPAVRLRGPILDSVFNAGQPE